MPQAAFPVVDDGSDPVGGTPESVPGVTMGPSQPARATSAEQRRKRREVRIRFLRA